MATIDESLNVDTSGYVQVDKNGSGDSGQIGAMEPKFNPMMRCPLPPVSVTPDSLRQFYTGGQVPQMRLLSPPAQTNNNSGNTSTTINVTSVSSSGGSSSGTINPVAKSVSFLTSVLTPSSKFASTIALPRAYLLLFVTTDSPCRIQIYGTSTAMVSDSSRAIDTPVPAGIISGVVTDLVLDSAPYYWNFQNRIGNNGDNPQNPVGYISITNLSSSISTAITVTVGYITLEN